MVMIDERLDLATITRREVSGYVASSDTLSFYSVLDDERSVYAVIIVPDDEKKRPAWAFVLARIVDNMIIIDEDGPADKPLSEALMVNGGVPREQIILACKGETLPELAD